MKETNKIKFSKRDFEESEDIAIFIKKIDKIDKKYIDIESDELVRSQPFLLSILLGNSVDLEIPEAEEILKIYFLIWEFFKHKKNIIRIKLTEKQFEKKLSKNVQYFKYLEIESKEDIGIAYTSDLRNINSKALLSAILIKFNNQTALVKMKTKIKAVVFIGIKSIIECFEDIIMEKT
ncbi:MAG: hypothetical protein JEY97_02265 [Bacteroidales bacterium]|nr:hypothetical protein [Bacteroidales bacterium]